jgi:hypothetical protein
LPRRFDDIAIAAQALQKKTRTPDATGIHASIISIMAFQAADAACEFRTNDARPEGQQR